MLFPRIKDTGKVNSLEESIAILDRYKNRHRDKITLLIYSLARNAIENSAIEGMYSNERDIIDLLNVSSMNEEDGLKYIEMVVEELKEEYKTEKGIKNG